MSKATNLIPNLNEIMEEYIEREEETVQVTQAETGQEEERAKVRAEPEQLTEESRKRKKGVEEARAERNGEKARDWVSEQAYVTWRDKLQHKDFIGERGFNKWISPFQEIIESKGWHLLCEHKDIEFVDVVKEFYANMVGMKDKTVYVRGKWISFGKEEIKQTNNLKEKKNGSKFKKLVKEPNFQEIVDVLTDGKGKWNTTRKNPHESISRGALTKQAKVWFYFLCSVMLPTKHLSTVRENEALMLYVILKGYKFTMGKIIENSILSYYRGGYKGLVPHPALITRISILGGVEGDWKEEENYPRTSPLTLTRIKKGPKNKGREREAEVAGEEKKNIEINQI